MAKFNFGDVKKQAQRDVQDKASGGGKADRLKLQGGMNKVLILPPFKEGGLYRKVMVHQVWKGQKPIATATCPRIKDGDDCNVCAYGWKIKEKYEDNKSKTKQELWKRFMPTNDIYVNALDLNATGDMKPQPLKLPTKAFELLLSEIEDSESGEDIFGLDEGRPMLIKGNGKSGNMRRYEVVKFSKNPAGLVSSNKVEEKEVMDSLVNLDKLQPKLSEEKLEEVFRKLKSSILSQTSGDGDDDEEDEDSEDESKSKKKKKSKSSDDDEDEDSEDDDSEDEVDGDEDDDDSDFEDDDSEESEDDEDSEDDSDDEEESDDSDDEDSEDDDSDEDDSDDEDEEDEKPKKSKKSSKSAPAKGKTKLKNKKK